MPENREKLTDESLQRLVDRIKKNAQLRTEMIEKITKKGVSAVVNELFVVHEKQNANMKSVEKILNTAVVEALETGGHIRLTQPDPGLIQPQTAVHVKVGLPGIGGIEVNVECAQ